MYIVEAQLIDTPQLLPKSTIPPATQKQDSTWSQQPEPDRLLPKTNSTRFWPKNGAMHDASSSHHHNTLKDQ